MKVLDNYEKYRKVQIKMISKTKIKYMSGPGSYSRGVELYEREKVLDIDIKSTGNFDEIVASVKGSGRNIYEVDFSIDKENEEVDTSYCDCPAYSEYDGLCKHCVAVLLEYNKYLERVKNRPYEDDLERIVKGGLTHTIRKGVQMHTTPELAALLQKQAVAKSLPLMQGNIYGKVKLEPHFEFNGRNFTVEFKIGTTRMYVLNNCASHSRYFSDELELE